MFQGALESGAWGGWSDFLERVEEPSDLGPFSYEVADTKLKRKPSPQHVLQLACYSDLLARVQARAPERAHVELGDGTRATFRLAAYSAYARAMRDRLQSFVADPRPTRPIPNADCGLCRWREHCAGRWTAEDSLFEVAGITRSQVAKLEAAGVSTLAAMAEREERVPTLAQRRGDGVPARRLGQGGVHRALGARPRGGAAGSGAPARPVRHPAVGVTAGARLPLRDYEIAALRKLCTRHGLGDARLDRWLRERRFLDLYAVVRGGVAASEKSYSIKAMEAFYGNERKGEVKTAGGSVVAYEKWRHDPDQDILDEIEDYNRINCVSTEKLRDWLASIRPDAPPRPTSGRRRTPFTTNATPRPRRCASPDG